MKQWNNLVFNLYMKWVQSLKSCSLSCVNARSVLKHILLWNTLYPKLGIHSVKLHLPFAYLFIISC